MIDRLPPSALIDEVGEAPPSADGDRTGTTPASRQVGRRLLLAVGWCLIAAGSVVVLYLAYSLLYTNTITEAAQEQMLEDWGLQAGPDVEELEDEEEAVDPPEGAGSPAAPEGTPSESDQEPAAAPPPGEAVALMSFHRPGEEEPLLHERPLAIVEGVTREILKKGPGRYPGTAMPGQAGNFAVAGHRTTYGAPFFHLDRLRAGDLIEVTDTAGQTWTYTITEERVVEPHEVWTIGPDPLDNGRPLLTLTTCYPRFSDAQRLVVFAELTAP
jgi:sortase A